MALLLVTPDTAPDQQRLLADLLAWYLAAGVDEAIADAPLDRFAPPPARQPAPVIQTAAPATTFASPDSPLAMAEAAAAGAATLEALAAAIAAFDGCALKLTATRTVVADGDPAADLMLIGEAPGADEDRIGRPFVGAAGQLLDRMLASVGIERQRTYITNTVFWRPPGNRKPTEAEITVCRPFVARQIALVRPRLIIMLGGTASGALLPGSPGITRFRGQWSSLNIRGVDSPIQALAMYHPSFLLRSAERKREAWSDLLSIKSKLTDVAK
jgi:DNA polymerase